MTRSFDETTDDFALMQGVSLAQHAALKVLYDRYSGLVFTVCFRVLSDRQEAEDILLEVFWELWDRADRYHPSRGAPRTYLVMLARSRAIDRKRSIGVRAGISVETPESQAEDSTWSPPANVPAAQDSVIDDENRQIVSEAMRSLDDNQRQALELSFYSGLTHRQIAEELDTPLGTVKTRIRLGLLHLRDSLRRFFSERDPS